MKADTEVKKIRGEVSQRRLASENRSPLVLHAALFAWLSGASPRG